MNSSSFGKQTMVYLKKIARIAIREKVVVYLLFAVIISLVVSAVVSGDMFSDFESTKSGFFTLASACIWIGIFNSIQSICKEHEIIRSDYRQGMRLTSYIFANILWQALLCLVQTIIIFVICLSFGFFGDDFGDSVIMHPLLEYFITISGVADGVANITFSKWGMSAFGSTANLNSLEHKMAQELPELAETIAAQYPVEDCYSHNVSTLLLSWLWNFVITVVSAVISVLSLKIKNRDS